MTQTTQTLPKRCEGSGYDPHSFYGARPCRKPVKAVVDGHAWCATHHPDAKAKREAKSRAAFEARMAHITAPSRKLAEAHQRIEALEAALRLIAGSESFNGGTFPLELQQIARKALLSAPSVEAPK